MRFNPTSKNYLQLNTITKSKRPEQSDFRVHFTLMGVYSPKNNHYMIINQVATKINAKFQVHLTQICNEVADQQVDISVGLFNDNEAYQFLSSKSTVKLMDKYNQQKQYTPIVSRAFQSYMKKKDRLKQTTTIQPKMEISLQTPKRKQRDQPKIQIQHRTYIRSPIKPQQRPQIRIKEKFERMGPIEKRKSDKIQDQFIISKTNCLWLFGIPIQYEIQQIQKIFQNRDINITDGKWIDYDHMEYLQINLQEAIPINRVFKQLTLKIQNYPFITIPKLQSQQNILIQLSKFIVQAIFTMGQDQQGLIHSLDAIGGVNILIRNYYQQQKQIRFIAVLNSVSNVERAKNKLLKEFHDCQISKKPAILRIGRLLKYYTFESLVIQLTKNRPKSSIIHSYQY